MLLLQDTRYCVKSRDGKKKKPLVLQNLQVELLSTHKEKKDTLKVQLFNDVTFAMKHDMKVHQRELRSIPAAESPCHFHSLTLRTMFLRTQTSGALHPHAC